MSNSGARSRSAGRLFGTAACSRGARVVALGVAGGGRKQAVDSAEVKKDL